MVNWPILVAFSNGKVQVRRDVIKQHCYLTLPLTGYLTPGRESKGRRRPVRVNKGVHPSQEQICSGFELLPRLLTHLRPLSFQCVSGESRRKKSSRTYTLFLTRALCGPLKPSLCVFPNPLSFMFAFRWSHPRASQGNNDCISKGSLVCYSV